MADENKKPLYDGRAKFSDLLVEKIKSISVKAEAGYIRDAYDELISYFILTHKHITKDKYEKIQGEINKTNRRLNSLGMLGMDDGLYLKQQFDTLRLNIIDATTQLLSPTNDEDDDDEY